MSDRNQAEFARERVLSAARSFLAGELDALKAAEAIARWRFELDPEQEDPDLLRFAGIESQVDVLLVEDSLKGWPAEIADQKRREYEDAEQFFRSGAEESARALIVRYGGTA